MPAAPTLQQFAEDQLVLAPALVGKVVVGCLQLLGQGRESGYGPGERADQAEVARALAHQRARFESTFLESLRRRVQESLDELAASAPREPTPSALGGLAATGVGDLALMDESRVEVDIELARAAQLIDSTAEWELRELQMYTSTLAGREHVTDDSHPFRPLVFASALWDAGCAVVGGMAERAVLLRTAAGVAAGLVKSASAAATARLEAAGVQPGVYRTVVLPSGATSPRSGGDTSRGHGAALSGLLAAMPSAGLVVPGAGFGAVAGSAFASAGGGRPRDGNGPPRRKDAERALDALESLLRGVATHEAAPTDRGADDDVGASLLQARAALAGRIEPPERQLVELVERLFGSMRADTQLPPAVRPLLDRLEVPILRSVLADRAALDDFAHPAWRLLNRIGELAIAQTRADDPALLAAAEAAGLAVDAVAGSATSPAPGAAAFRQALETLDRFLAERMQTLLWDAADTIEALKRAERRELLEQHLTQRLVDQMVRVRTTPAIRRFVTGAWARVIAIEMLGQGDHSESALAAFKAVDDLLWSLRIPDHPQSRQRLVALLPGLLQRVRAGMEQVALPEPERRRVLDDLMAAHTEGLRPGGGSSGALSPDEIVQRLRDETDADVATPPRSFSDSVIDLSSMETVPVDVLPSGSLGGLGEGDAGERVEAMRAGDRYRVFYGGAWRRVQLLWRSDRGLFFHFSGDGAAGGRNNGRSITRRALDKAASAGLVQPLESRPMVQRAADRLAREAQATV